MGWHDDDFPDEETDPGAQPVQAPRTGGYPQQGHGGQPQPSGHGHHQGQHPPNTGGYPQQQQRPPSAGYQPQPPNTGRYPQQQQRPPSGGHHQSPNTGGVAQQTPYGGGIPHTGNFPAEPAPPNPSEVKKLSAPVVAVEEEAKASRVVFGLSGTAVGGVAGVILGVLNTKLEGQTITEGTDFIFMSAIWFSFLVGLLCFLFPERFAYAIMKWTDKDDDEPLPPS